MSLYTDISTALSKKSLSSIVSDGFSSASVGLGDALGGSTFGNAIANTATSMARNAASGLANKYVPSSMQRMVNSGTGALGDVLNGDFSNAGLRLFDSGMLDQIIPGMSGIAAQARYFGTPTPLFGGLSPSEAREIFNEMRGTKYCRKNLWLIEVSSAAFGDASGRFNLFATDLEYAPFTITGEKHKVGAAHVDSVTSADPVELRLTTYDDDSGFIKYWFKTHCQVAVNGDGTVGVPADYAIKIKIVHGFVTQDSNLGGYEDIGLFRPGNIDLNLSRKEDSLQELSLSFVQLDTFIEPSTISG
ncbi:MAG: hypothetical protein ACXWT0_00460 [Methylobacter sp.]